MKLENIRNITSCAVVNTKKHVGLEYKKKLIKMVCKNIKTNTFYWYVISYTKQKYRIITPSRF